MPVAASDPPALHLELAGPDDAVPPSPFALPRPAVDTWRDNDGGVCAYTYESEGRFFMDWPAIAHYCFDASGRAVRAWPQPGVALSDVARIHRRAVVPAAMQCLGFETLHASAVRFPHGVVGFCGHAGAGKSTLAVAATSAAEQWADDTLVMAISSQAVSAVPIPYDVGLRAPSRVHFRSAPPVVVTAVGGPAPLLGIFVLERGAAEVTVSRLDPTDALQAVLPHACTFSMLGAARRRLMLEQYLALVDVVPVFTLSYRSGFEHLPVAIEVIARSVSQHEPAVRP
jgi:hypothetical protein